MIYNIGNYNLDKIRDANFKLLFRITATDLAQFKVAFVYRIKMFLSPFKLSKKNILDTIINNGIITKFDSLKKLDLVRNRTNTTIEI